MTALRTTEAALVALLLSSVGLAAPPDEAAAFDRVERILERGCAMPVCHGRVDPQKGLRLDRGQVYRTTVNVPARTDRRFLRVAPGDPQDSLLYRKLLSPGEGGYHGPRMPLSMDPLSEDEIAAVRAWIESFPEERWGPPAPRLVETRRRILVDSHLATLPGPDALGAGTLQFRILHRFRESTRGAGSRGFYGLDGSAAISLGLAYGFTDRLELGFRRTNELKDYEADLKGVLLDQGRGAGVSLAIQALAAHVDDDTRHNPDSVGIQLVLGRSIADRLSLVAVPTWVTRTNKVDPRDRDGTVALGLGGELRLRRGLYLTGEWIGQIDGVDRPYQSASLGLMIGTAGHAFHLVATNTQGTHTDQVAPGGDLDAREGDFRLGFNISRTFRAGRRADHLSAGSPPGG